MNQRWAFQTTRAIGLLGVACFCLSRSAAADQPPGAVLLLTNDGTLAGDLRASADPKVLRWHSPAFAEPLDFPLGAVKSVRWLVSGPPQTPRGEYCFELGGDDCLFGKLLGVTDDLLEIDSARFGRIHLRRQEVRRFYRWDGAELIYFGPHGLADWKDPSAAKNWRDEGGPLATNKYDATLFGSPGLPEKALVELELSWKQKPDFVLELGVVENNREAQQAFRFEVWDDELVVVGESKRDADLASLQKLTAGEGSAHIQLYLDQAQKRLIVLSRAGQPVATLKIDSKNAQVSPGIRLTNKGGDVRLETLRITRWNGAAPAAAEADKARVRGTDGVVVYGNLKAFDPKTRQFKLVDGAKETALKQDEVSEIYLISSTGVETEVSSGRPVRAIFRDGSRLSGTPTRLEQGTLAMESPGIKEPLKLAVADLQALSGLHQKETPKATAAEGRLGTLKLDGLTVSGKLVDSKPNEANKLTWQPDLALHASAINPGIAGAIVYREPPPPPPPMPEQPVVRRQQQGGIFGFVSNLFSDDTPAPAPVDGRKSLHLRSGDVIPCEVTTIDEHGVTFKSPLSAAKFVPHEKIKSVELMPTRTTPRLDETKRDRLLTLPRLQKDTPPTHLICSANGDFLRGRIVEMNDKTLKVEVRLEVRQIPRDRVAQIIWLHADELTNTTAQVASKQAATGTRVQVMRADGNRLTFMLENADKKRVSGTSSVLGACHADLTEIDQVLFGSAIEDSAAKLAYNLWKLRHAAVPRYVEAAAAGDSPDGEDMGKNSPLVGQAAYAFKLPMLDGPEYDLASRKGKVVVLDFWATWCGPCMQTAPLFEEVMKEFVGRDVELIGVNMEEQPEQIKSIMERHKLKFRVALDRDGGIAARYAVTAIPQTVVIDRDGKIARLFVGGGKKTAESLHKAIDELLTAKP